ncbi:MAG: hypothetical protein QXP83_07715 [Candidatus Nezhaarchaeales archaeon]
MTAGYILALTVGDIPLTIALRFLQHFTLTSLRAPSTLSAYINRYPFEPFYALRVEVVGRRQRKGSAKKLHEKVYILGNTP